MTQWTGLHNREIHHPLFSKLRSFITELFKKTDNPFELGVPFGSRVLHRRDRHRDVVAIEQNFDNLSRNILNRRGESKLVAFQYRFYLFENPDVPVLPQ